MVPGERELQGIRGDRGYDDTYLVFDRQNNIGELGGEGTFVLSHDPGDEIVEIVLTLTLAQNPTETMQRVLAGLNSIGDDAAALAAAQAALAVPAPVDPSDFEPAGAVATHTGDTSGAHAASAISNTPAGNIAATDVQAALNELDTEKASSSHTHAASAITNTPAGSIAAVTVQAAIDELDTEKQPVDGTLTALAGLTIAADSLSIGTGADAFTQTTFAANTFPAKASTGSLVAKTITDFGLSFVDDADASAGRSTLGLGTLATQSGTFSGTSSGTNTGDQTISLTGDVTGSGTGSFAATIANAAVTLAKMADLAQDAFIVRTTASTGVPQTATCTAAARTVLDDATVAAMVDTLGGASSTGSGGLVRATSPTLVTPNLGTPSTLVGTNVTGIPTTGILDAAVTLAKQANLAQDTIIGRETASTGVPEAISHKATGRIICASTSIENLRQRIGVWRFWEEFVNGYATTVYTNSLGGSGNVYIAPHGYYAHHQGSDCQGILLATTAAGTAGTDVGCVYGAQAGMYLSDGAEFVFRMSTNSATSQKCRFGLRSDAPATSADAVNGAYFELETGTSTNWYGCTAAASSRTKTTTSYSNSNTNAKWQWFRIKFISGASGVVFSHYAAGAWVDDLTISSNIPTSGVNRQVRFFMQAIGNGAAYRDLACDGWGIPIPSAPPVPTA